MTAQEDGGRTRGKQSCAEMLTTTKQQQHHQWRFSMRGQHTHPHFTSKVSKQQQQQNQRQRRPGSLGNSRYPAGMQKCSCLTGVSCRPQNDRLPSSINLFLSSKSHSNSPEISPLILVIRQFHYRLNHSSHFIKSHSNCPRDIQRATTILLHILLQTSKYL